MSDILQAKTITGEYSGFADSALRDISSTFLTAHQDLSDYQTIAGMTAYANSANVTGTAQYGLTTAGWSEITGGGSVPTGVMTESGLEYDASGNISAYSGSAFAAQLPEEEEVEFEEINISGISAASDYISANSANIDATVTNVSSNSAAWGGSALPISAGPGIDVQLVDNKLVFSAIPQTGIYNETLLFSGSDAWGYGTIQLSESLKNFKRIKVLATRAYASDGNVDRYSGPWSEFECAGIANTTAAWGAVTPVIYEGPFWKFSTFTANSTFTELNWFEGGYIKVTNPSEYAAGTAWNDGKSCGIKAVIGINRTAGE